MQISTKDWRNYIQKLAKLNQTAADLMTQWVQKNGFADTKALTDYAYALVTKYGEGSAELACEMYDAIAELSGAGVAAAEPAATATYGETAKAVNGSLIQSPDGAKLGSVVNRLVKLAGADTTLQNAQRDGAQWAWIPSGDTCAFCRVLGSRGWQYASSKVMKGNHAEHIHGNCDCAFAIRFNNDTKYSDYDPDALYEEYMDSGTNSRTRINAMRRKNYAENADKINAQHREAYKIRTESQ